MLTWAQLGLHAKPIVLLDTEGYWQPLVRLIEHTVAEGFAEARLRADVLVAADVAEAVRLVKAAASAA